MAVIRWGLTFRVTSVYYPIRRASARTQGWILSQTSSWQLVCESRSSACGSPPSLRYHSSKQLALSPLSPPSPQPPLSPLQGEGPAHWEDSIRLCVLVGPGGVQVPLCCVGNLGDFLLVGAHRSSELCFPLTTVDGRRPDDISVGILQSPQGCSRTALSQGALRQQPPAAPQARCWSPQTEEGSPAGEDGRREEKLTQMYERLRVELPAFFQKNHDYSMYSADLEFINGLLDMKSRGRVLYQLSLSLWRLVSLFYYAEVRLEVLKLTKHLEDGTIRARWRVKGLPFHSLLLHFYYKDKTQLYRTFDAFSTFFLGEDGLIHCHKVEKVMPAQPPILPRLTSLLSRALVALGLQEQRPALNLLPLLLTSLRQARPSQQGPD